MTITMIYSTCSKHKNPLFVYPVSLNLINKSNYEQINTPQNLYGKYGIKKKIYSPYSELDHLIFLCLVKQLLHFQVLLFAEPFSSFVSLFLPFYFEAISFITRFRLMLCFKLSVILSIF